MEDILLSIGWVGIFIGILCFTVPIIFLLKKSKRSSIQQQVGGQMGEIKLPEVFDEAKIRSDLARYKEDTSNLKVYLNGLSLRFQAEEQMRSIRKITELLSIGREYLDAVYETQKAQGKLGRIELEEQVEKKRLEVEMAELEAKEAKLKAQIRKSDARTWELDANTEGQTNRSQVGSSRGNSPAERLLQSTRDRIQMLQAKGSSLKDITEGKEQELAGIDSDRYPDLYKQISNMWDDYMVDIRKK